MAATAAMKLGCCYNVFDGEELLERSVESIRSSASFVCVVYQVISNFGEASHPNLVPMLQRLQSEGKVDLLIPFTPKQFTPEEKTVFVAQNARPEEVGGSPAGVSNQFFNELMKRELGRQACLKAGCSHFMSMDTDEFYLESELRTAMETMLVGNFEGSACKMRTYFKNGNYELLPYDELNWVPLIYVCREDSPLLLACPYPITVDPTRRLANISKFHLFERDVVEMHHLSFVRMNISCKMRNVSNRDNHDQASTFVRDFNSWTPEMGVIHPHPHGRRTFQFVSVVPNLFNVDLGTMCGKCYTQTTKRCSRCRSVAYCSPQCQKEHWPAHKAACSAAASTTKPS